MIWHPLTILQAIFPSEARRELARVADRWRKAANTTPALAEDLIRLGEVIAPQPARLNEGYPTPALPDAIQLAYAAGRRDMALQLLALMNLTASQTHALMKEQSYDDE
ncbi:hypothetical protein [Rhodoferax sp.]|uniref:hypothetical protein n=1 Tax=Rhodoferax sp. TaxID=50421 RepID=UPI002ACE43A0|nr:hypothetical protein [Rhodoferax sp.]MDZ7919978.1 hypothetical protein [Rhodoferax sp.]